jgi:superfamily II DNA or RNA helicase
MPGDQSIGLLDFYRNSLFGFFFLGQNKGYYARASFEGASRSEAQCPCIQFSRTASCAHIMALERLNQVGGSTVDQLFQRFPLTQAMRAWRQKIRDPAPASLPGTWQPFGLNIANRLMSAWGWLEEAPARAKRDRLELQEAKAAIRSPQERLFQHRGMLSAELAFEESRHYSLVKWLFLLDLQEPLIVRVSLQEKAAVRLQVSWQGQVVFTCLLPLELYACGIIGQEPFWRSCQDFALQARALPVVFSLRFAEGGALVGEPMVEIAPDRFVSFAATRQDGIGGFHYHGECGFFPVSHPLSLLKLSQGLAPLRVEAAEVMDFLHDQRQLLRDLDSRLMDSGVFSAELRTGFDELRLQLGKEGAQGFAASVEARLGNVWLDHRQLVQWFAGKGRHLFLAGHFFDAHALQLAVLAQVCGEGRISHAQILQLRALLGANLLCQGRKKTLQALAELEQGPAEGPPSSLDLRAYQQKGAAWLGYLWQHGLGGLLCDQMGLGKTHQAMALMEQVIGWRPQARILVVCPFSVIFHWEEKLRLFLPQLKVVRQHGLQRLAGADLSGGCVLTTYGTLRSRSAEFRRHFWDLLLLDEIQHVKNADSQNHRALLDLRAHSVVGLTGTPIENSLQDLKSLLLLSQASLLGREGVFRATFGQRIEEGDAQARSLLKDLIRPFILRRAKSEVLSELPPKSETTIHFDLLDEERAFYEQVLQDRRGSEGSVFLSLLHLIDRLKRLCNHRALFEGSETTGSWPGAKWNCFLDLLDGALASGEKVVVFTQFPGMIRLIGSELKARGLGFASIQGSTRDRAEEQRRFMVDPQCRVFLGSIRAAGAGIDLTAGTVLIHYDRWWNPAREEQATDRIHRLGQTAAVSVYKLVARGTIEERIEEIIQRKRALLEEVLEFDDPEAQKRLSLEDLRHILGF